MKQVPDTETTIHLKDGAVDEEGVKFVVNPYDEFAMEEALKIKEAEGGTITVITMGPARSAESLRSCLALGGDEAIHLKDDGFEGSDALGTARIIAKIIGEMEYDLILCGKQAVDTDNVQVGIILAELLDIPHVNIVTKLELNVSEKKCIAHREIEGATALIETPLPVVITCQKGLNEPRYPSLKGIMMAKRKPITEKGCSDIGIDPDTVGITGAKSRIVSLEYPPERPPGRIIEGETPGEVVTEVVKLLREEAKVI
jgi:electron transfer flavoprotein beta subunit